MKPIKDPLVAYIESELDTVDIISSYFPDWMKDFQNVMCPYHDDNKTRSLHISPSGKGYCHGCGHKLRDIVDLVAQAEGWSYEKAKHTLYSDIVETIPESEVEAYITNLERQPRALNWLKQQRHLNDAIIKKYRLGYEPKSKRIVIPIYDQFGHCRNLRRMGWLKNQKPKALNVKGKGEVRLFPEMDVILNRKILLVEGEWDCLVGKRFGLPTVTWTGGCRTWNEDYSPMFKGKAVWVLYDNDDAGNISSLALIPRLTAGDCEFAGALETEVPSTGKDLTDWSYSHPHFLDEVKHEINSYKFEDKKRKRICPSCGQEVK